MRLRRRRGIGIEEDGRCRRADVERGRFNAREKLKLSLTQRWIHEYASSNYLILNFMEEKFY